MKELSADLKDLYCLASNMIGDTFPVIAEGMLVKDDLTYRQCGKYAEEIMGFYVNKAGADEETLKRGLDAFGKISFDFIKLQSRFLKKGSYNKSSSREIIDSLYYNPELMRSHYLDGLLLTYAFWPNHAKILRMFIEEFLNTLPADCSVMEIGVGHGLMALHTLKRITSCRYLGLDISPSSVQYARDLLLHNGIRGDQFTLIEADATQEDALKELRDTSQCWDASICCEVLEHVDSPGIVLKQIREVLGNQSKGFFTTVANIDAEDHVYLFKDIGYIRSTIKDGGFTIEKEAWFPLKGFETTSPLPLNYVAIVTPKIC